MDYMINKRKYDAICGEYYSAVTVTIPMQNSGKWQYKNVRPVNNSHWSQTILRTNRTKFVELKYSLH